MLKTKDLKIETKEKYRHYELHDTGDDSKYEMKKKVILEDVNIEINKGDFVIITGDNGSGKTTLLKTLIKDTTGLDTSGSVQFNGVDIMNQRDVSAVRRKVGNIFQNYSLIDRKTVAENILYPLEILKRSQRNTVDEKSEKLLSVAKKLGILTKLNDFPHQLSGGEAQRVVIARSLILNPDIFIVDEPTSNLDKRISRGIMEIFEDLNAEGKTIIMVTHHKELLTRENKRLFRVEDNKIKEVDVE